MAKVKKKGVNVILIVLVIIFLALFVLRRTEQVGFRGSSRGVVSH